MRNEGRGLVGRLSGSCCAEPPAFEKLDQQRLGNLPLPCELVSIQQELSQRACTAGGRRAEHKDRVLTQALSEEARQWSDEKEDCKRAYLSLRVRALA